MKAHQIITDKILELLDKGVVPWRKGWGGDYKPCSFATKKNYRGINYFLLLACTMEKGYASNYWLTFNQAKQMGGQVKKGEKAMPVIFWKWLDVKDKDTGENKEIPFLRHFYVFNVEQCEGLTLPEAIIPEEFEHSAIDRAEDIIRAMPLCPEIRTGESRAYYSPDRDMVNMPKPELFAKREEYYGTLFHELVHSTGHEKRLDRKSEREGIAAFGSLDYGKEELVAEMGAAFLCGAAGIESVTIENSAAYIDGWRRAIKGDKTMVVQAAGAAQKAADYILGL